MALQSISATDARVIELKEKIDEIVNSSGTVSINTLRSCQLLLNTLLSNIDELPLETLSSSIENVQSNDYLQERIKELENQLSQQQFDKQKELDDLLERYRVDMTCEEGELEEASKALDRAQQRIKELENMVLEEMQQELKQQRNQQLDAEQQWRKERTLLLQRIEKLENT
ncbi:hypothetical protein BDF19DRAFT_454803 [Syncephalis fuscata]|nr:hypothetical protein BDF19DRAFT_454803 [Syncephalis fuscata]